MAVEQRGFQIGTVFYAAPPESYRVCDPVLIREVTGLDWRTFAEMADDPEFQKDPVLSAGVIAVAIWQRHPDWARSRVINYVQKLDMQRLTFVGPDEEDDELPLDVTEDGSSTSSSSPESSSTDPTSLSEPPSPSSTGQPTSVMSST